jgi:hypothetical protein
MSIAHVAVRLRRLRETDVSLRRPTSEIHLHVGQVTIIAASSEAYTPGRDDLRAEAAALRKLAGLALKVANELEDRAAEVEARTP